MKKILLWLVAFLITAGTAFFQRMTGPTYPLTGKTEVGPCQIEYLLPRSHETTHDFVLELKPCHPEISGYILYKRFKTDDPWTKIPLILEGNLLSGKLPLQPPAGKLAYQVILTYQDKEFLLSGEDPVIIRFKGKVPGLILLAHIITIFLGMLFSTRAGLEALRSKGNPRKLALWTLGLLFAGGMFLGPIVQYYAFGAFWTGFPFGYDLTDNKTLIVFIVWLAAVVAGRKDRPARKWVLGASVLTLIVFLIPHSLLGSELKYD